MEKKTGARKAYKRTDTRYRKHETFSDETDLRDEILELKRQLMLLKRENEQYLVKVRKYEDESKRKDKQLEELMDPRKNADITKFLSTKGAVILMNLKDQNNALIQIILNKDLHIRRLMAELKTTKLYASTKKNETYRAEINRLKNLLIKLEQTLKENKDVQQQRSICAYENSFLGLSSPSSQSSPRDLHELRQTISNLESHIKYSHDLLAEKNQEISLLADKVNLFSKFFHHKRSTYKTFDPNLAEFKDEKLESCFDCVGPDPLCQIKMSNQDVLDFFEKSMKQKDQGQTHPPLTASTQWFSSFDSTQKYSFQSHFAKEKAENQTEPSVIITNEKNFEKVTEIVPVLEKSLFQNLVATEIKKNEKIYSNSKKKLMKNKKGKWKKALDKYRNYKKLGSKTYAHQLQIQKDYRQNENANESEFPEKEVYKGKDMTKVSQKCQIKSGVLEKPNSPGSFKNRRNLQNLHNDNVVINSEKLNCNETCQSSQKHSEDEEYQKPEIFQDETHTKKDIILKHSLNTQKYCLKTDQNASDSEETESKKSFKEIHLQSFDSEYNYSLKQEVQQVQVEAQINSLLYQSDSDQLENNQIFEHNGKNRGNNAPDLDFNDDDDVIIREKYYCKI